MVRCKVRYLFTSNQINQMKIKTHSRAICLVVSNFAIPTKFKNQHQFQITYYVILNNHPILLTSVSNVSGFIALLRILER